MSTMPLRRALLSVSDKSNLEPFAKGLAEAGVELFSTGGTRRFLQEKGLEVQEVAAYTGFPEMMDGRVKTLHPKIFAGILARRSREDDLAAMKEHEILPFDLIVVNLYPFESTVAKEGIEDAEAIEQIDIGGPSLIRAAAKNFADVAVCTKPEQYGPILDQVKEASGTDLDLRRSLAKAAFERTAAYDRAIADYFAKDASVDGFPETLTLTYNRRQVLRYGENPHQQGAFFTEPNTSEVCLANAEKLNGKELSYNNLLDLDSALCMARGFSDPAAIVIKHNNPCGAAEADSLAAAFHAAYEGDPISAFGSVIGFNRPVDAETAEALAEPGRFIEAVVAPDYSPEALEILTTKPKWKKSVRLLKVGDMPARPNGWEYRRVDGGMLVQGRDYEADAVESFEVKTKRAPTEAEMKDLIFGWNIVRHVKSNAIVLVKDRALIGVGAGQMSRVDSVMISLEKAGDRVKGAVMASDAFFPFPDSIEKAAAAGITAVVEPGGSVKDPDVIDACDQAGLAMLFTGRRHFKH
ncbi:Bifunctional phosphoribosylaminoimidazolecarboxamide formyltransferase/IMP cyclohydrolase [Planctomycetales bacterium 10988]|nr:Bifunctional phosphoribosylaminoimidazolecarboxamide formyltransferase/IMP cyclohydrolase [Planctomycetales bacterium 10988]